MTRLLIAIPALWAAGAVAVAGEGKIDGGASSAIEAKKTGKTHQEISVECFNKCWTLIDKADRSPEEDEDMLLLAHASLWHWKQRRDCKPLNLSIGYWQVSRVYALVGEYEMARLFGQKCLKVGQDNHLPPFYVGYAYEALARAEVLHKGAKKAREFLAEARGELKKVTDKEEKELLEADVATLEKSIPSLPDPGDRK